MTQDSHTTPKPVYLIINQQVFNINKDLITIGRKLGCDIVIQDNFVSRVHAEIRFEDGKYVLYDLGSTSGSFINNKKVAKGILYSGDLLLIANVPMIFIDDTGDMESPTEDTTEKLNPKR